MSGEHEMSDVRSRMAVEMASSSRSAPRFISESTEVVTKLLVSLTLKAN